jgi:hypothetical protein
VLLNVLLGGLNSALCFWGQFVTAEEVDNAFYYRDHRNRNGANRHSGRSSFANATPDARRPTGHSAGRCGDASCIYSGLTGD